MIQQIRVSTNAQGMPQVNIQDLEIWSTQGDQVQWVGVGPYVVFFSSGSPFASSTFTCPAGSSTPQSSGPITAGASGSFKYNVQVNGKILDPRIIVKP